MEYQLDLALARPGAAWLLVCSAVAAGVLAWPVARLFGWRPGWTLLALLSLAPILVFTAPLEAPGWQGGAVPRLGGYVRSFLDAATFSAELDAPASPDERLANLLLFVPLGLFGTLATRRALSTAVAAAALSFGVEGWQAVSDVRVATAADWLYNSGGALLGAAAGLVLLGVGRLARLGTTAPEAAPPRPPAAAGSSWPPAAAVPPARPPAPAAWPAFPAPSGRPPASTASPARPPAAAAPAAWPAFPAPSARRPVSGAPLERTLEFPAAGGHEEGDETTVDLAPVPGMNGGTRLRVPPW